MLDQSAQRGNLRLIEAMSGRFGQVLIDGVRLKALETAWLRRMKQSGF
jgi:hypothetical protein